MTRRLSALLAIAILIVLVLVLVWNVYQHHELTHEPVESAVVRLDGDAARAVVIIAPPFC